MIHLKHKKSSKNRLNIIPLINVVFLLLIFFMLTSTAIQQGMEVELPKAETAEDNEVKLTRLTIAKNGDLEIDSEKVTLEMLGERLENKITTREKKLMIEADRDLEFSRFGDVLDRVREVGIVDFVIATEPLENSSS
ncbi:MAG: biopolymer transporter ExbD [Nitrospina sp.]|jgi:biopolymer transport protein ExbD|nr:biopolymer transporter ExbD [Nitrospina sp.]MBT3413720.1 biopolymer transporter ExbD [Nitrospina sp.]MBT3856157.1 biopolymer transporter ExbD [Nitrospina sp.]MBT4105819.1 biopolymer transporter ExbD [Nitrospina sp.]MBT4390825.1 biopolymer transporter ExbD [Nitrospina sp.]